MRYLVTKVPKDSKLVVLPEKLVARLQEITTKKGISLSGYATEAMEQSIKMNEMGAKLSDAVDFYFIYTLMRAAGIINIPRANFNNMISDLYKLKHDDLWKVWNEAGKWNSSGPS